MAPRRLLVMRHAKSSWSVDAGDVDRPLSSRGRRDAGAVAQRLATSGQLRPQMLVASPARRSAETVEIIARMIPTARLATLPTLYEESAARILADLRRLPTKAELVCVVGHFPQVEAIVRACAEPGPTPAWESIDHQFATCAFGVLEVDGDWSSLGDGRAVLSRFETPR